MHNPRAATVLALGLALLPSCAGEGGGSGAPGDTVRVALGAFEIEMPDTLPARTVAFRVTNRDTLEHSFQVEQRVEEGLPPNLAPDRIEEELASALEPGGTETLTVELRPGGFRAYCPLADHEDWGMRVELTVGPGSG